MACVHSFNSSNFCLVTLAQGDDEEPVVNLLEEDAGKVKQEDELQRALKERRTSARNIIIQAAKLIAPKVSTDTSAGYDWCKAANDFPLST